MICDFLLALQLKGQNNDLRTEIYSIAPRDALFVKLTSPLVLD